MKKIHKRKFIRNDKKELLLFGYDEHNEKAGVELDITENTEPHMRWNPSREEWVVYSSSRKNRTTFPPKEYCPLCPGKDLNYPTEIPFNNFEIAVFPNRWASFSNYGKNNDLYLFETKPSKGECEVLVYSSNHLDSFSEMPKNKVELLIKVWVDRYKNLLDNSYIKYVLPFENRGEECGVTLHHPHGQIYAFPFIPPVIEKEINAFKKENFLLKIMDQLEEKYFTYQNDYFVAAVPPFARYAYEVWIIPKRQIPGPWKLSEVEVEALATTMQKVVRGFDNFLKKRCPYIMGLHSSPKINDDHFHFHIEFYPPLRHENKPKVLAGSESMAGVFIMDVLPEDSAKELREYME